MGYDVRARVHYCAKYCFGYKILKVLILDTPPLSVVNNSSKKSKCCRNSNSQIFSVLVDLVQSQHMWMLDEFHDGNLSFDLDGDAEEKEKKS